MDTLDMKLIALLQKNGRASNAQIARQVGVSEGTVRRRLKSLLQSEVVHVVAVPNPNRLGYGTEAIIGLQVDPDRVESVSQAVAALDEAQWVAVTTGSFDIFMWVILRSPEELSSFLGSKVGSIPGVRRSETFVNLNLMKREVGLPLQGPEEESGDGARATNGRRARGRGRRRTRTT